MTITAFRAAERVNFGISMVLILLALHLIHTKSRKEINQYRKLLVIFLVSGIFFALLHIVCEPTMIIRENLFLTYSTGWITSMEFIATYYGVVSMSFLILATQFVYRAIVLSSKIYANVEIKNKHVVGIILVLTFELIVWIILCVLLSYRTDGFPVWIIVLVIMLLLVVAGIILFVCWRKRQKMRNEAPPATPESGSQTPACETKPKSKSEN